MILAFVLDLTRLLNIDRYICCVEGDIELINLFFPRSSTIGAYCIILVRLICTLPAQHTLDRRDRALEELLYRSSNNRCDKPPFGYGLPDANSRHWRG